MDQRRDEILGVGVEQTTEIKMLAKAKLVYVDDGYGHKYNQLTRLLQSSFIRLLRTFT